jgi:hypothetical protein
VESDYSVDGTTTLSVTLLCCDLTSLCREIKMRPQIVLFGDSITEQSFRSGGWGSSLANTYSRKVQRYWGFKDALLLQLFFFVLY